MKDVPRAARSSRRDLLKRALVVLGAGVLIQPYGGVSGLVLANSAPPAKPKVCVGGDAACATGKKQKKKICVGTQKPPSCYPRPKSPK